MAKGLTDKQRKVLEYIIDYQKDHGYPPTIRETGDAFGIGSLRGVTVHLDALVRKGFVTRDRASRSLRVVGLDPREPVPTALVEPRSHLHVEAILTLPLLRGFPVTDVSLLNGKIDTGDAVIERYIAIPEEFASAATENGFLLRVGATGIYGEPVVPGDLLIVRPQRSAVRGELVVYITNGDLSVQRHSELLPSPDDIPLSPVRTSEIVGRVVGLLRRY